MSVEQIQEFRVKMGFDRPWYVQYASFVGNALQGDFGYSFKRHQPAYEVITDKSPATIKLAAFAFVLSLLVSIPLGVRKAVHDGERFDTWTSGVLVIGYAIPGFLFAVLLLVLFAGGSFFQWFPSRGLTSDNWSQLSLLGKLADLLTRQLECRCLAWHPAHQTGAVTP